MLVLTTVLMTLVEEERRHHSCPAVFQLVTWVEKKKKDSESNIFGSMKETRGKIPFRARE